jgi:quercetin dioxygenase-like cupin family protein
MEAVSAAAQDGAKALTRNYRTLLDNERVQVVRVHYDPHEVLAVHAHSHYPTVYCTCQLRGGVCL